MGAGEAALADRTARSRCGQEEEDARRAGTATATATEEEEEEAGEAVAAVGGRPGRRGSPR